MGWGPGQREGPLRRDDLPEAVQGAGAGKSLGEAVPGCLGNNRPVGSGSVTLNPSVLITGLPKKNMPANISKILGTQTEQIFRGLSDGSGGVKGGAAALGAGLVHETGRHEIEGLPPRRGEHEIRFFGGMKRRWGCGYRGKLNHNIKRTPSRK